MRVTIDEGRMRLAFAEGWHAIKWDAGASDPPPHPYRDGIERLKGDVEGQPESTKAVDVVAASPAGRLCLLELKDFRPDRSAASEPRSLAFGGRWQEVPVELALKVRDTLAGLYGVVQRDTPSAVAAWVAPTFGPPVFVCALVAQDATRPSEPRAKRQARDSELLKNLRRRLAWLTASSRAVMVLDPFQAAVPPPELVGLAVTDISR